jgi:hypothetical protein
MNSPKCANIFLSLFTLIIAISGFLLVGYFSNWYVAGGLYLWTWANNLQTKNYGKTSIKRTIN